MNSKPITVREYEKIPRNDLSVLLWSRLQRFDEQQAGERGETIFDWSRLHYVKAKSIVGVIQIPGLCIEILPKIDSQDSVEENNIYQARHNLLYMLSLAKQIPLKERDLANQRLKKLPLLETFIRIFAERLITELNRGLPLQYIRIEENLSFYKGKLQVSEHIRQNIAHKERFFLSRDEFTCDNPLCRAFKVCCRILLNLSTSNNTRRLLQESLLHFADVNDITLQEALVEHIALDRNTERFQALLDFCRILLQHCTPAASAGRTTTFSLLFPMEVLFEEFVARFIYRHASDLDLYRPGIAIQACGKRKNLMRDLNGKRYYRLKPDLVISDHAGDVSCILDTKWKRLYNAMALHEMGVTGGDLYQLFAYAKQYECNKNILLYPKFAGTSNRDFHIEGMPQQKIRLGFINLNRDLFKERKALVSELKAIIHINEQCTDGVSSIPC
jgi:5-methylcytosine-specific restriction enzyme subunit McrC